MSHASVTFIFLSMKNNKFMSHTSDTLINLRMKKDKRLMLLMLTFVASFLGFSLCSCSKDNDAIESTAPDAGKGHIDVVIDTGGANGDGSSESPIIVKSGKPLNMVLRQQSSYTDPDGTVITREPAATISVNAKMDTLFAKDIKELTAMNGNPKMQYSSTGISPLLNKVVETFDIGGQEITFDLGYEIYSIVNSESKTVEMPYIKLNPAQYGTAVSDELTRGATHSLPYVTGIKLTPLNQTRGVVVTDSTAYKVSVSFNLDTESVNTKEQSNRNLSFTVDYIGIVETSTEYPDPETSFSYSLNVVSGTADRESPFTLLKGKTMQIEWNQSVKHTYFSVEEMAMKQLTMEPKAQFKLSAASDTLWVEKASDFEKVSQEEPNVSVIAGDIEKKSTNQVFDIGGQKISSEWLYEICHGKMSDGKDIALPYLELGNLNLTSVRAEKKGGAEDVEEIGGKTVEVYEITAKFSQDLTTQQFNDKGSKQTIEYIVKYIGVVEVKLVDIVYRKDYVWHPPHDNIPLALQLIVYRDRVYSNSVTFTDEYRSNLMDVTWVITPLTMAPNWSFLTDQDVTLPNGERVFYHKSSINHTDYGCVVTCKTRVSDIFAYTSQVTRDEYALGYVGEDLNKYYNFRSGEFFDPSAPKAGWYSKTIDRYNTVEIRPKDEIFFLRRYEMGILFPDRFCYIKDNIDERMIDFFDKEMTYDYNYQEEQTTTPEGYPARIITRSCKTEFFGKEFNFSITDTIYQTTPLQ